jgi:hypothetical protein
MTPGRLRLLFFLTNLGVWATAIYAVSLLITMTCCQH